MTVVTARPVGAPLDEVDVHAFYDLDADVSPNHNELAALRVELAHAIGVELVNRPGTWVIIRSGSAVKGRGVYGPIVRYTESATLRRVSS